MRCVHWTLVHLCRWVGACGRVLCARLNSPVLAVLRYTLLYVCVRAKGVVSCSCAECVSAALVWGRAHSINPPGHQGAPQWTDELRTPVHVRL